MEFSNKEMSPKVCLPLEDSDVKYVSGLSTVLVATIQEAKDRISQIEYIFCSQLYPNVQKSSKCLQKLYSEARRAAEDEWKERVSELELRVEQLRVEKDQACENSKVEKSKLVGKIADLEEKLLQKAKEVDDGMVLHGKLLDLIESKTSIITNKEKQMKEHEERTNVLISKLAELEGNIVTLNKELQEKNEEVSKGKELREELLKQIESQAVKITSSELMLASVRKDNKKLAIEFGNIEISFLRLKDELKRKSVEVEEGNRLREQLIQQANLNGVELTKKDQQLSVYEGERNRLLCRINDLENEVEVLQENLKKGMDGKHETCEHHNEFAQQIERKNLEIASEKQKARDLLAAYKRLKSQHNFLLLKYGLTSEESLREMKAEGGSDPSNQDSRTLIPPELNRKNPASSMVAIELNTVKKETNSMESSDGEKGIRLNPVKNSHSPSTSNAPHWTTKANIGSSAGTKRPAPGWRETRSRPSPGGPDPHDDFLDTPYENIRGNLRKSMNKNVQENPPPVSRDMDPNSSDDDDDATQDMKAQSSSKKQQFQAHENGGPKGFKYVEPVRKKAERENLNGVECKQCKKFYDAVLSDGKGRDGEVDKRDLRCEHHEGVSRHRYRYAPPMTPEGFWNIGFDTET